MAKSVTVSLLLLLGFLSALAFGAEPTVNIRPTFVPDPKVPSKEVSVLEIRLGG